MGYSKPILVRTITFCQVMLEGSFGKGLWNLVLKKKYLKGIDLTSWLHKEEYKFPVASIIWKNFMGSF